MIKRILTAVIGIPLLIFLIYKGGNILLISIIAVTLIALNEYASALENSNENHSNIEELSHYKMWLWFSTLFSYVILYYNNFDIKFEAPFLLIVLLGISSIQIFKYLEKAGTSRDMFYGYVYITIFFRFIFYTAQLDNAYVVWLIFIIAWSTDTFAYFAGLLFGKHKLAPIISPKKTIEGAIGGIVGCAVSTFIFSTIFIPEMANISILFGIVGSMISQMGDLNASMIKRSNGIKDFGHIIPGHGGILDRFDSILFTAPYVYVAYNVLSLTGVIK